MHHTTGFAREHIVDVCSMVASRFPHLAKRSRAVGRKQVLGLFKSVVVTSTYLRRNHAQAELAEYHGASQSTISRRVAALTPIPGELLAEWVPTVEDLDPQVQLILDGTLLPCWSWSDQPEPWSGKHRTTGVNVQVAATPSGHLAWMSDPLPGKTHDAKAIRTSGLLHEPDHPRHLGDKGYIGLGMLTPIRKPPGGQLLDWQKQFNTDINAIRYQIERVIANLKTRRILHTDYRRPLTTFPETITAVVALEFHRTAL